MQSAQVPAAPPRAYGEDDHLLVAPLAAPTKHKEEMLVVINAMRGRMHPQVHESFVVSIKGDYAMHPGAEPPDSTAGENGTADDAGAAGAVGTAAGLQQRKAAEAAASRAGGRFSPA